ncbi:MAG: radical SAM protein [Elusimicrobiota bacterium]
MSQDILFINPRINVRTQRETVSKVIRATFPFSLGHLAGYLLREGYSVGVVDDQLSPLDDEALSRLLSRMRAPKIVGISVLTATSARAYELAGTIKRLEPSAQVILGGVHATVLPEEALSRPGPDYVVRGEGELTLSELVRRIAKGQGAEGVQGVSHRCGGTVIHNPERPLVEDLDSLPRFPYHLFAKDAAFYPGFASVQTSRGCPFGCKFCSQRSVTGRSYRYVSTTRAIAEIETLVNTYGATTIRLMDDNIGTNKERLIALCDAIIARGFHKKASFEGPMRGDDLLRGGFAAKLKEANFSLVTFGLETASNPLMKAMGKGETVEQVAEAIRITAANGISVGTTLIFGFPGETNADRWAAIRLVSSLPLESARYNILTPYPGTPIYHELLEQGKLNVKKDWENFSVQYMWESDELPYVPEGTGRYELMFFAMLGNLLFYLRPSGLKKLFTGSAAGGNVIQLKKGWYLSTFAFRIVRVGLFLIWRFSVVCFRMILEKLGG